MQNRPKKIAEAMDVLAHVKLNAAEKLRVAEKLVEYVQTTLLPLDGAMSVAQGKLEVAMHAVEAGRDLVEGWPATDLPVP